MIEKLQEYAYYLLYSLQYMLFQPLRLHKVAIYAILWIFCLGILHPSYALAKEEEDMNRAQCLKILIMSGTPAEDSSKKELAGIDCSKYEFITYGVEYLKMLLNRLYVHDEWKIDTTAGTEYWLSSTEIYTAVSLGSIHCEESMDTTQQQMIDLQRPISMKGIKRCIVKEEDTGAHKITAAEICKNDKKNLELFLLCNIGDAAPWTVINATTYRLKKSNGTDTAVGSQIARSTHEKGETSGNHGKDFDEKAQSHYNYILRLVAELSTCLGNRAIFETCKKPNSRNYEEGGAVDKITDAFEGKMKGSLADPVKFFYSEDEELSEVLPTVGLSKYYSEQSSSMTDAQKTYHYVVQIIKRISVNAISAGMMTASNNPMYPKNSTSAIKTVVNDFAREYYTTWNQDFFKNTYGISCYIFDDPTTNCDPSTTTTSYGKNQPMEMMNDATDVSSKNMNFSYVKKYSEKFKNENLKGSLHPNKGGFSLQSNRLQAEYQMLSYISAINKNGAAHVSVVNKNAFTTHDVDRRARLEKAYKKVPKYGGSLANLAGAVWPYYIKKSDSHTSGAPTFYIDTEGIVQDVSSFLSLYPSEFGSIPYDHYNQTDGADTWKKMSAAILASVTALTEKNDVTSVMPLAALYFGSTTPSEPSEKDQTYVSTVLKAMHEAQKNWIIGATGSAANKKEFFEACALTFLLANTEHFDLQGDCGFYDDDAEAWIYSYQTIKNSKTKNTIDEDHIFYTPGNASAFRGNMEANGDNKAVSYINFSSPVKPITQSDVKPFFKGKGSLKANDKDRIAMRDFVTQQIFDQAQQYMDHVRPYKGVAGYIGYGALIRMIETMRDSVQKTVQLVRSDYTLLWAGGFLEVGTEGNPFDKDYTASINKFNNSISIWGATGTVVVHSLCSFLLLDLLPGVSCDASSSSYMKNLLSIINTDIVSLEQKAAAIKSSLEGHAQALWSDDLDVIRKARTGIVQEMINISRLQVTASQIAGMMDVVLSLNRTLDKWIQGVSLILSIVGVFFGAGGTLKLLTGGFAKLSKAGFSLQKSIFTKAGREAAKVAKAAAPKVKWSFKGTLKKLARGAWGVASATPAALMTYGFTAGLVNIGQATYGAFSEPVNSMAWYYDGLECRALQNRENFTNHPVFSGLKAADLNQLFKNDTYTQNFNQIHSTLTDVNVFQLPSLLTHMSNYAYVQAEQPENTALISGIQNAAINDYNEIFQSLSNLKCTDPREEQVKIDGLKDVIELDRVNLSGITYFAGGVQPGESEEKFTLANVIRLLIRLIFLFISGISIIGVMYGGFLYTQNAGDDGMQDKARKTITYALLGLVLTFLAYLIVAVIQGIIYSI